VATEEGIACPSFKLERANTAGRVDAQENGSPNKLREAANKLEAGCLKLHPVKLHSNMVVEIPPTQSVELWGQAELSDETKILPRSEEFLPRNVTVDKAELLSSTDRQFQQVRVIVRNRSKRVTAVLSSQDVLAELHMDSRADLKSEAEKLEALIGPCCESSVTVSDIQTKCLIDSGSQVTVVSESFYRERLSHLPLQQVDMALNIVGAGGQTVPYLGVITTTVALPEQVGGTNEAVETSAVVCPDTQFSARVPIIIGTNTLRLMAKSCEHKSGRYWSSILPIRCEVAFAYKEAANPVNGRIGSVKLLGHAVTIPPHDSVEVKGVIRQHVVTTRDCVLVQEPTESHLPDGLCVLSSKAPTSGLPRVKVVLVNHSDSVLRVKCGSVIADLFSIQAEYAISSVLQQLHEEENGVEADSAPKASTDSSASSPKVKDLASRFRFGEDADPVWKEKFTARLLTYVDVFNQLDFDIGRTDVIHDIELTPGPAVRERPRPIPPQDFEEVRQHIQQLLDANIIKPSTSPFASPIVLVRKKNGALRMCIDYRRINARTVRDSYALPKIEDLFRTLSGSKFFTSVDLSKAYYQVPLSERAKKISAFATPFGLYEFERLSFGLVNAPMTFQRLMEQCFRDMNLVELIIFLDDVLIHAETLEELEERTIKVLERLRRFKLKLDPDKCVFCATEVKHLGFLISGEGIRPDPEKTEALRSWPVPTTVKEVKAFVGFAGYYRRFVSHFSHMAKPLNDLTIGYIPRGTAKKGGKVPTLTLSSSITHLWGDREQKAFDLLIKALTSEPILGIADKTKPFLLHCDASGTGLGAVLYQEQEDGLKVIAYASRGLNRTEANYPAHKREFLALKWSMTDKFHDYLIGSKVTVVTDNNPLCYVLKNAKLDATSHRWLAALSIYDFDLKYRRGPTHIDADGLSRRPQPPPEEDEEYQEVLQKAEFLLDRAKQFDTILEREAINAIMSVNGISHPVNCFPQTSSDQPQGRSEKKLWVWAQETTSDFIPAVETVTRDPSAIPDDILEPVDFRGQTMSMAEWRRHQRSDDNIATVIDAITSKQCLKTTNAELKVYQRERSKLSLQDGVLFRCTTDENGTKRMQLVVPHSHRSQAMKGVHEELFHTHFDDAIKHARMRFFWPFMATDLERKIKRCERCVRRGVQTQKAPMGTIETSVPLELLCIDFLTIEVKGKKQDILVVMDHYTKYAKAIPTSNQLARTVAKALWEEFFLTYGFPQRILSDQGRDFESTLIKELCSMLGIKKIRTTPYHPAGNPVERWNRTLIGMLRSLDDNQKVDWRKHLKACVHAYNASIHQSTGFSPFYLFYGRHPTLPVDLAFGTDVGKPKQSPREYIKSLKRSLQTAYQAASANMAKMAQRNKAKYDLSAHAVELEPGDRCLVRKMGPRIKSKVDDRWEKEIYKVISKTDNVPVYTVKREDGEGAARTLHRNLLLPIGALEIPEEPVRPIPVPRRRQPRNRRREVPTTSSDDEDDEELLPPTMNVEVQMKPDPRLHFGAPVFVPGTPRHTGTQSTVSETEVQTAEGVAEEVAEPSEVDVMESEEDVAEPSEEEVAESSEEEVAESSEEAESSEGDTAESSSEDAAESVSSEVMEDTRRDVPEDRPRPMPRRSTRIRRPIERLNYTQQCKVNVDPELLESVRHKLQIMSDSNTGVPVNVAPYMEHALWAVYYCCQYV